MPKKVPAGWTRIDAPPEDPEDCPVGTALHFRRPSSDKPNKTVLVLFWKIADGRWVEQPCNSGKLDEAWAMADQKRVAAQTNPYATVNDDYVSRYLRGDFPDGLYSGRREVT